MSPIARIGWRCVATEDDDRRGGEVGAGTQREGDPVAARGIAQQADEPWSECERDLVGRGDHTPLAAPGASIAVADLLR